MRFLGSWLTGAQSRFASAFLGVALLLVAAAPVAAQASTDARGKLIAELNNHSTVQGPDDAKSYRILFDAYLKMTKPPQTISRDFNLRTIHVKMPDWAAVSGWAEANPGMAEAILKCKPRYERQKGSTAAKRTGGTSIVGLPYGEEKVPSEYREAGLMVVIGAEGNLRDNRFPYLAAVETIAAYSTAETYRLLEAGKVKEAGELTVATLYVLRQFCDRRFISEKRDSIDMLIDALGNLRDQFWTYLDKISVEQFTTMARNEIPPLLLLRRRLELPEGDRIAAEALIRSVFDEQEQPIESKFAQVFGHVQAAQTPLELFGAIERWRMIGRVHASLPATLERLKLVYDDWWRRWQLLEYEPTLDLPTEFERLNPVRYAAVAYSLEPLEDLFPLRDLLIANINGTAMAAGLCAYHRHFGSYPNDKEKIYAQFVRKTQSDLDPFDYQYGRFLYRLLSTRTALDTPDGRIWIEPGAGLLWARGDDHQDNSAATHTDSGSSGSDVVIWPPVRALARQQGLLP